MNAPVACLLFAAAIDWLESLLPVLFVGFWILSQVFAIFRRVAGGGEAAKGNGGARPQPPAAPEAGPELRGDLQKQIEEFLRQATGERPVQPKPQPRPIAQPKPAAPRPVVAKAVTPPAVSSRETAPRAGVERNVGSFAAGKTDVARHVQDAFAHDLKHDRPGVGLANAPLRAGRSPLAGQPAAAPAALKRTAKLPVSTAAELLEALRNPATIRQTILLREVLERPVDRW
ncbi:MAG: hypothetical protein NTW36_10265 [Planctomycetia bacterium]|nr:hypothetical protein [Planctomycetia bacterium]